jgi:hypothetical protein
LDHGIVSLHWEVDCEGYRIDRGRPRDHLPKERFSIAALTWGLEDPRTYDLNLGEHDVFRELAMTPPTEEGAIAFTNRWGQLGWPDWYGHFSLTAFFKYRGALVAAMKVAEHSGPAGLSTHLAEETIGTLEVKFERRKRSEPQLLFRCNSLIDFCFIELLQTVAGGADITTCRRCKKFLPIHRSGRPAKYCSDACKQAFYYQQRTRSHRNGVASRIV